MPVVKSKTRKDTSFKQLVGYITEKNDSFRQLTGYIHKEAGQNGEQQTLLFNIKNIEDDNIEEIAQAFQENDSFRRQRQNGVVQYHEIISFSPKDRKVLENNPGILSDMALKYLELRAPNSLAIARPHFDKDHVHIHLMISGNQVESSEPSRISQKDFNQVKQLLNEYQLHHYPELANSTIEEHDKQKKERIQDNRGEIDEKRTLQYTEENEEVIYESKEKELSDPSLDKDDVAELEPEMDEMAKPEDMKGDDDKGVGSPYFIPSPYWEQETNTFGPQEESDNSDSDDEESIPSPYWGMEDNKG